MRWIIGDIHGMLRPLEALLAAVGAADPKPRLYFAGDYVNRGPDSRGVVELLLSLKDARMVRGNHDDIFDHILSGQSYTSEPGDEHRLALFEMFMRFGLEQTLLSYGADVGVLHSMAWRPRAKRLPGLVENVPEAHRRFFRELPLVIEEDDLFIAHALWDPCETTEGPLLAQRLKDDLVRRRRLLWGRYEMDQITHAKPWGRTGYFGHTPTFFYDENTRGPHPMAGPRIVLLDTGAFDPEGRLTAFCPDTGGYLQADHFGKLIDRP